jgi:hypothetical protein
MRDPHFTTLLERAIREGLDGAALVARNGSVVGLAGSIDEDEAMPLAALVMHRLEAPDLAARLFAGEILTLALDERDVAVGVAKRQLFVVAVVAASTPDTLRCVRALQASVERMLADAMVAPLPGGSSSNSGSGPAELPVGITIGRPRGKA